MNKLRIARDLQNVAAYIDKHGTERGHFGANGRARCTVGASWSVVPFHRRRSMYRALLRSLDFPWLIQHCCPSLSVMFWHDSTMANAAGMFWHDQKIVSRARPIAVKLRQAATQLTDEALAEAAKTGK